MYPDHSSPAAPVTAEVLSRAGCTRACVRCERGLTETLILTTTGDAPIRPFSFHASDEELADLKRRIAATRWPERELVDDGTQGVQLALMQKLAEYWATDYDWRRCEAR